MRIMLDTNIIISAGIFGGGQLSELTLLIADKFNLVLPSVVIEELRIVIQKKFPLKMLVMERFLKRLSYEISYTPANLDEDIYPKIRDKKDYPILASAIIADVDILITGDKDFNIVDIERPEIMTITDFAQKYL